MMGSLQSFIFEKILPYPKRLHRVGHLLWFYQKSGLQNLARGLKILKLFPSQMRQMEQILPEVLPPKKRKPLPEWTPNANPDVKTPGKAAIFHGCIMDVMFRGTNMNSIQLLAKSGFDVHTPCDQTCCGALHLHTGNREKTIELAKRNIETFEKSGADYIVSNAGGCGASLHEYEELFRDDSDWLPRAQAFSAKVCDISELIVKKGSLPNADGEGERVTYQPSCHLQYVMGVKDAPKQLLKNVSNTHYVELPGAKFCCGSAGIYNLLQPGLANDILDKKMEYVRETQSDVLITANPGCFLQMKAGLARSNQERSVRPFHIVDYLTESINKKEGKEQAGTGYSCKQQP